MTSLRFVGCRVKLKTLDVVFPRVGCALLFAERQASSHGGLRPPASGSFDSHCLRKSPIHATHPQKVRNLIGGGLVESKSKDWIDVINPESVDASNDAAKWHGKHSQDMFAEKRSILEPAGALSLAGAEAYCKYYGLKGTNVVAITSGANMNFDRLRLATGLADVGRKREAMLATILPEEHGSF